MTPFFKGYKLWSEVLRKGIVTTLLEQIQALEGEMEQRQAEMNAHPSPSPDDSNMNPNNGDSSASSSGRMARRGVAVTSSPPSHPGPEYNDQVPDVNMNFLSLSAVAEPHNREGEFLKQLSTPCLIAGVTKTYGGDPETTDPVDVLWKNISRYIRQPVGPTQRLHIPRDTAFRALSTYLEVVDYRLPRLPVPKVRAGIDAISEADGEDMVYNEILGRDPAHIFMAYAVVAIAPLISENYPIAQGSWVSVHILGVCLKVLDHVFDQEDGVDRRFAFWGWYHIERFICAALARPFSISDDDITIPLPGEPQKQGYGVSSTLTLEEEFHVHHFRYARLLSLTSQDLPDRESTTSGQGFDYNLGHALHWHSNTPPPSQDPKVTLIYHYHTSLFNTLMLRIAIFEIVRCYVCDQTGMGSGGGGSHPSDDTTRAHVRYVFQSGNDSPVCTAAGIRAREQSRIKRMNLLNICQSVARLFDRSRLVGRQYLSLITGYNCLSLALACLYHVVIEGPEKRDRAQSASSPAMADQSPSGFHLSQLSMIDMSGSSPLALTSTSGGRHNQQQGMKMNQPLDAILDLACRKLEIVGRQFPRFHTYRALVLKIRCIIGRWPLRQKSRSWQCTLDGEMEDIEKLVGGIDPVHLRRLADAIIYMLTMA
ncbi:hypothetical protein FE257_011165 [Aspergillus nanangensis]|uniref:Xylanolytic transcriptional activator regulatory domain-containing protein n=1 Tax=Aspergillus nanangensis TaxID=2582783 RepID=A0AAD4CJ93_ASPNN|nr:hypothetical protein FE257_011165 [Aspergillus nanangensis]